MDKVAFYGRVSTEQQDLSNQLEAFNDFIDKNNIKEYDIYKEKVSAVADRKEFNKLLNNLDDYNYIVVTKMDRLVRSTTEISYLIERLNKNNVYLKTIFEPIDTSNKFGDVMATLLSIIADIERKNIRERLKTNYNKALKEGTVGRNKKIKGEAEKRFIELVKKGLNATTVQMILKEEFGIDISRTTYYNYLNRLDLKKEG